MLPMCCFLVDFARGGVLSAQVAYAKERTAENQSSKAYLSNLLSAGVAPGQQEHIPIPPLLYPPSRHAAPPSGPAGPRANGPHYDGSFAPGSLPPPNGYYEYDASSGPGGSGLGYAPQGHLPPPQLHGQGYYDRRAGGPYGNYAPPGQLPPQLSPPGYYAFGRGPLKPARGGPPGGLPVGPPGGYGDPLDGYPPNAYRGAGNGYGDEEHRLPPHNYGGQQQQQQQQQQLLLLLQQQDGLSGGYSALPVHPLGRSGGSSDASLGLVGRGRLGGGRSGDGSFGRGGLGGDEFGPSGGGMGGGAFGAFGGFGSGSDFGAYGGDKNS
jgi:hypothetical protein